MAELIQMPKLGMDMEEGTILKWLKQVGESIKKGEPIAEIETDKSSMELEAPCDGNLLCIYHQENETIPINTPIAAIGLPDEVPLPMPAAENDGAPPQPPEKLEGAFFAPPSCREGLLTMPKLGMDMVEGQLLRWLKEVGSPVQKGDMVAQIETDKSAMELESPYEGILLKTYCGEGDTVLVGQPLAFIGAAGSEIPVILTDTGRVAEATPLAADYVSPAADPEASLSGTGRLRVSPRARRLARQSGVDLRLVSPSGSSGRIMERDVRAFLNANAGRPVAAPFHKRKETVTTLAGIRKVIATRMHQSLSEMAQANHRMDADMINLSALRRQLNQSEYFSKSKVTFLDLVALACTRALTDCPFANVSLMPDGIHARNYVNLGIAVDTPRGLVVPVIHDADTMDLFALHAASAQMIEKARSNTLKPDDMRGGTFTISNLGMFGIDSFTAIINPPESCILAIGRIADRPVVVDKSVEVRPIMTLSLTYDHRVLDGAPAAKLLQRIQFYLENPAVLLLSAAEVR